MSYAKPIWARLQLLFAHGVAKWLSHGKVQARVLDEEVLPNIDRVEPYGFSYRPKPGAQTYLLFPSGDRSYGVAIVIGDKQYNMQLQEGEVALHDDEGNHVHIRRGGAIEVNAADTVILKAGVKVRVEAPVLEVTGEIRDLCDGNGREMSDMRAIYNTHTHPENDAGGPTDEPNQGM
ncbi:MAG: phage baseplate assembly protein [Zoogloeaceae bacterium]|jgi:phage gp45-like|nr:phage baseplate assembly protein [Zoogloeaceae bacterium]